MVTKSVEKEFHGYIVTQGHTETSDEYLQLFAHKLKFVWQRASHPKSMQASGNPSKRDQDTRLPLPSFPSPHITREDFPLVLSLMVPPGFRPTGR